MPSFTPSSIFKTMSPGRNEQIIEELQKQYDVVQVDPTNPITEKYDVLLAVQPSSLNQQQMDNFIAAVKTGQATAIFEDPFPFLAGDVPGTKAPKQPPGGADPFMQCQLATAQGRHHPALAVAWRSISTAMTSCGRTTIRIPSWASCRTRGVRSDSGSGAAHPFNDRMAPSLRSCSKCCSSSQGLCAAYTRHRRG